MLNLGLHIEQLGSEVGELQPNFKFHPFNCIALNAYTTLGSAYRIHSSDLLDLDSEKDEECQLKAFNMSRASAAYSLFLAGVTHHLFSKESSLIVSAANFWTNAGESLLNLARSSVWNSLWGLPISEQSTILEHKCSLMDIFDAKLILSEAQRANFENITIDFINCVSNMKPKIWRFLVDGCSYLETFEDRFDFRWIGHDHEDSKFITEDSIFRHEVEWYTNERRVHIYEVGIHCLLYGGILAYICYGQISHLSTHILNVLYNVE
ncbi:hypothetical protein PTKIN_Ptkin09bG0157000 [Pterospermum kingtungense]